MEQRRLTCLERCAGTLEAKHRELILRYYGGRPDTRIEHRRAQASELGMTTNALPSAPAAFATNSSSVSGKPSPLMKRFRSIRLIDVKWNGYST